MSDIVTTAILSATFAVILMFLILTIALLLELILRCIRRIVYRYKYPYVYLCSCGRIISSSETECPYCNKKVKFRSTGKL